MTLPRRAFSLVELLLAVFILGIGFIGISALFPAGIAQQRQANDDVMGPIVADNAMAILRLKLKPEWFGTMEEFFPAAPALPLATDHFFPNNFSFGAPTPRTIRVAGDWVWRRPGFLFANDPSTTNIDERGAIDIFSALRTSHDLGGATGASLNPAFAPVENSLPFGGGAPLYGIPYNRVLFDESYSPLIPLAVSPDALPLVIISREERAYPMGGSAGQNLKRPSYFWECMFRRFGGRIQVAIFVYSVIDGGGEPRPYWASQGASGVSTSANIPPLPILADLAAALPSPAPFAPWRYGGLDADPTTVLDNATVKTPAVAATPGNIQLDQSWQLPDQWVLDENNTVHRVRIGRKTTRDPLVTLTRPIPSQPPLAVLFGTTTAGTTMGTIAPDLGARLIWFIPSTDSRGFSLIPVYVTVQEL